MTYDTLDLPLDHIIRKIEEDEGLELDECRGPPSHGGGPQRDNGHNRAGNREKRQPLITLIKYFEYENLDIRLAAQQDGRLSE